MNGMPSNRPSASSVASISSLRRISTQSPTFSVLLILTVGSPAAVLVVG
jgi:hypothetical protein